MKSVSSYRTYLRGATKEEFRRIFNPFGTLSDIYFGGRKGKNGKNFGFIRFTGGTDTKTLEARLNGTLCKNNKLEINIVKHERETSKAFTKIGNNFPVQKSIPVKGGFVRRRSYAEVTGVRPIIQQNQSSPNTPVRLHADDRMMRIIRGKALFGKVKSLEHLGHLLALMSIHGEVDAKVKYAGGMKAFIEFGSSALAKNFLENGHK